MQLGGLFLGAFLLGACVAEPAPQPLTPTAAELGEPRDDIDPAVIGAAVRENPGRFHACFASARETNPSLSGLVEVRFLVNPDGTIRHAAVAETNLPATVVDCVVNAFYNLRLPSRETATVAQYPMYFQPG